MSSLKQTKKRLTPYTRDAHTNKSNTLLYIDEAGKDTCPNPTQLNRLTLLYIPVMKLVKIHVQNPTQIHRLRTLLYTRVIR